MEKEARNKPEWPSISFKKFHRWLHRHRTDRTVKWSRALNPGGSPAFSKLSVTSDGPFPPVFLHI
jgi:hypothetical protein